MRYYLDGFGLLFCFLVFFTKEIFCSDYEGEFYVNNVYGVGLRCRVWGLFSRDRTVWFLFFQDLGQYLYIVRVRCLFVELFFRSLEKYILEKSMLLYFRKFCRFIFFYRLRVLDFLNIELFLSVNFGRGWEIYLFFICLIERFNGNWELW